MNKQAYYDLMKYYVVADDNGMTKQGGALGTGWKVVKGFLNPAKSWKRVKAGTGAIVDSAKQIKKNNGNTAKYFYDTDAADAAESIRQALNEVQRARMVKGTKMLAKGTAGLATDVGLGTGAVWGLKSALGGGSGNPDIPPVPVPQTASRASQAEQAQAQAPSASRASQAEQAQAQAPSAPRDDAGMFSNIQARAKGLLQTIIDYGKANAKPLAIGAGVLGATGLGAYATYKYIKKRQEEEALKQGRKQAIKQALRSATAVQ